MSNRNAIFLAVGMLVLGLVLGGASGGMAGFFMGRNSARPFAGQFNQPFSPNNPPFNQNPGGNFPQGRLPFAPGTVIGARVMDVEANSPSDKAGLRVEDVITAIAGTKIDDTHSLADLIKLHKPGEKIDLTITRGNQTLTITIELGASPNDSSVAYLGIRYAPFAPQPQGGRRQ